ncbi:MAG: DUF6688 family protein [Chloroflexota bacterium]
MENTPASIEASETRPLPAPSLPFSLPAEIWKRALCGLIVTMLPVLCFWGVDVLKPEWQSGRLDDYVALLLSAEASILFFVLLAYSVVSYLLLLVSIERFANNRMIRLGVYSGLLLAIQYFILSILFTEIRGLIYMIPIWIAPLVILRLYRGINQKWGEKPALLFIGGLAAILFLLAVPLMGDAVTIVLMFLALSAPFWSLLLSGGTAIWLFRNFDKSKLDWKWAAGVLAWLAAYGVAWRYDVLKMFELYSALPTEPPNCYIATAAANGHPGFVRSREVRLANGKSMRLNRQLQRLKYAELALLAIAPRLHASLRKIYDVVGRRLARRMDNPYVADAAYLLLKPSEWMSFIVLNLLIPEIGMIVDRLYRS